MKTSAEKRAYMAQRRAARTPEQIEAEREYQRLYRAAHPELNKKYYWKNPEARRTRSSSWSKANRERANETKRQWRARNVIKDNARLWRQQLRRYGLTEAEFQALLESQQHLCKLCDRPKKLCVDHDHETGAVRGLLCSRDNLFVGVLEMLLKEGRLERLLQYIRDGKKCLVP